MNSKKWIKIVLLLSMGTVFFLFIFVTIVIDPYNENKLITHKFNLHKPRSSYTSSIRLFDKLKTDKYILLFGTSRSLKLSKKILGKPTINFSGSIYGEPTKVFNFLKQLNQTQKNNIIKIYYLLDMHTFSNNTSTLINYNSYFEYIKLHFINFNLEKVLAALETIILNLTLRGDYMSEYGWIINTKREVTYGHKGPILSTIEHNNFIKSQNNIIFDERQFNYLSKLNKLLNDNNIQTIYFTPTFNIQALKEFNFEILDYQYKKFSNILNNFYDLTYIPVISNDYTMYTDSSHLKYKGFKYIFKKINFDDYNVNKNNMRYHMKNQQQKIISYNIK